MLAIAVLSLLSSACEDNTAPASDPTATSLSEGHPDGENFNEIVQTGASRSAAAGFAGTYRLQVNVEGSRIDGTATWYRKGAQARADFAGTVDGQAVNMNVITGPNYPADDLLYVCRLDAQTCSEAVRAVDGAYATELLPAVIPLLLLDVGILAAGLNFYDEATRTIVGQPASCFVGRSESEPPGLVDHGEVCLTDGGLPLLITAAGTSRTISLTAIETPGGVSDRDFELPYAVGAR